MPTGRRTPQREAAGATRQGPRLADLVDNISYEVIPFKNTERDVLAQVPTSVPLTVTATAAKGIDTTLDLTGRLSRHGYTVSPHLPARLFIDDAHVADVVDRLRETRVRSVFVIGGDAPEPAGRFPDAYALLRAMEEVNHPFEEVGVGGYPEGHTAIRQDALERALTMKAPMATRILTQICFDATTTARWAAGIARAGIGLPVHVGIPGPANRQKLMRISAGLGLGQSARFLRKQQNLLWRLLLPGGYDPTKLVRQLGAATCRVESNIRGLHIFTFNELSSTELWRRRLRESLRKSPRESVSAEDTE